METHWGESAPIPGEDVQGLPHDTMLCYTEARICATALCYTACEQMCRKVLIHVAVDQGAKNGLNFVQYLDFLLQEGHISKNMEKWVTLIRDHGNKAAHRLDPVDKDRALNTLYFTESLLKIIYEVPYRAGMYLKPGSS